VEWLTYDEDANDILKQERENFETVYCYFNQFNVVFSAIPANWSGS